jgi:hypothetical protein
MTLRGYFTKIRARIEVHRLRRYLGKTAIKAIKDVIKRESFLILLWEPEDKKEGSWKGRRLFHNLSLPDMKHLLITEYDGLVQEEQKAIKSGCWIPGADHRGEQKIYVFPHTRKESDHE